MPLQIARHATGYLITSPGDTHARIKATAKTAADCARAVAHYFEGAHARTADPACPVCKQIARELGVK